MGVPLSVVVMVVVVVDVVVVWALGGEIAK